MAFNIKDEIGDSERAIKSQVEIVGVKNTTITFSEIEKNRLDLLEEKLRESNDAMEKFVSVVAKVVKWRQN